MQNKIQALSLSKLLLYYTKLRFSKIVLTIYKKAEKELTKNALKNYKISMKMFFLVFEKENGTVAFSDPLFLHWKMQYTIKKGVYSQVIDNLSMSYVFIASINYRL